MLPPTAASSARPNVTKYNGRKAGPDRGKSALYTPPAPTRINLARPEGRSQIRSTKSEILNKSESPKTRNSKQTIASYFDGGYCSPIPISSIKNNVLKDCITDFHSFQSLFRSFDIRKFEFLPLRGEFSISGLEFPPLGVP